MSIAILVINTPNKCAECKLRCSTNGEQPFCFITCETVSDSEYYDKKPTWCPLREVPKKQTVYSTDTTHHRFAKNGYNACINEILGKDDKNER